MSNLSFEQSSLFNLIEILLYKNKLVPVGFGCLLASQFLDVVANEAPDIFQQVVSRFSDHFQTIFEKTDLSELCNIEIDPETKRMCIYCMSCFFFTYAGGFEGAELQYGEIVR